MIALASIRESLRRLEVRALLWALKRDGIPELSAACQESALRLIDDAKNERARRIRQELERQRIAHCYMCLERFSLKRLPDGRRTCTAHAPREAVPAGAPR